MAELRFTSGGVEGALPLEGAGPVGLGRGADNQLVLDAPDVSRYHARLLADERGWRIEDLGSANGILVNGERVVFAILRDGARINIGGYELVFVAGAAPEQVAAAVEPAADEAAPGYYLSRGGERFGPYFWPQLQTYAVDGTLGPDDLLWGPGLERWTAARELPGLLPAAPLAPGAPPPVPPPQKRAGGGKLVILLASAATLVLLTGLFAVLLTGGGGTDDNWQAEVLGLDDDDWERYSDRKIEEQRIEESLRGFQDALRAGDVERSVSYVADSRQGAYAVLFNNRPEAMPQFAELLGSSQMSYLDPVMDPNQDTRIRTAEYTVTLDGFDFYVRWAKVDGRWVLFDF